MFRLFGKKTVEMGPAFRGGFSSVSKFSIASAMVGSTMGGVCGLVAGPFAGWDALKKSSPDASVSDKVGSVLNAVSVPVGKGVLVGATVGAFFPVAAGIGVVPTCAVVGSALAVKAYVNDTMVLKGPSA